MVVTLLLPDWLLVAADRPPAHNWGLAVEEGRVAALGSHAELRAAYPGAEVILAPGQAVVPGFVNAHHHMYGVLSHGIPLAHAPTGFWSFLEDFWWPKVEDALSHEWIAAAAEWACLEMIRSGVTTFYDCLEAPHALPGCLEVEAEVVRRRGLRGILSFEATQRVSEENGQLGLQENAHFIQESHRSGGLVSGMVCFHTTFTCDEAFIRQAFALAEQLDAMVHMHCAEGRYEPEWCLAHYGRRTVEVYADWGLLGRRTLASQCVQITRSEIDRLAAHGVRVSHMPLSNCEVGGGFSPVPELLKAGVTVGLGTDGYVNDFFALMRGAFLLHKARLEDPGVMPARTVWHLAGRGGAEALNLEGVGALELGFSADLAVVDLDLPTPVSVDNLLDQLLLWRNAQHVDAVMCAGRWLMRDKEILGVDEAAVRARCQSAARALWAGA
jgi:5-methylthioadenosine/S-adenosylhomocysteine deaminase